MTTEQALIEIEEKLLAAFKSNDLAVLEDLIHDSCLFVLPNGISGTKAMVIENYRTGHTLMTAITASERLINIVGDTATIAFKLRMQGHYGDQVLDIHCRYIRVWKLIDNNWRVIATAGVQL